MEVDSATNFKVCGRDAQLDIIKDKIITPYI